jgi:hypothetical protein
LYTIIIVCINNTNVNNVNTTKQIFTLVSLILLIVCMFDIVCYNCEIYKIS